MINLNRFKTAENRPFVHYLNYIESVIAVASVLHYKAHCGINDFLLFYNIDRLGGCAEILGISCFDLDKDDVIILPCNNVNLSAAVSLISVRNFVALMLKKGASRCFAESPNGFIISFHIIHPVFF